LRNGGRGILILLGLALLTCGAASAAEGDGGRRISLGISIDLFRPFNGTTRERFGETWFGIGGGVFDRRQPTRWNFNFDLDYRSNDRIGKATLVPLSFGVIRAMDEKSKAGWQPFVALRAGPYYGKVRGDRLPIEDESFGLNANATLGVLYRERYALSLRYDYFSRFARSRFDGLSLRASVRVLDVKL
jgi:hypothetical protein